MPTVNGDVCGSMVWLCLIGTYGIALGVLVLGATLGLRRRSMGEAVTVATIG